ncbi:RNA polymerase sigma factor [Lewinella sp. IMCC34183]|uniref:RNA polymerase sigma factor n=1 Tax=Lewinella sp. IMCC34183 TaxID=2248762 RepID=UPI0013006801|nr:RNA polymerase sigma factor [Lewinella sp. IMCC34183]
MPPAAPDIHALIAACRRGEARGQEAFYRRYFPLLLPVCLRYLGNRDRSVEVLNRAMLRIFQSLDDYTDEGKLEGWLTTVTRNTVLTYIRDESRAQRRFLDRSFVWPASVPNGALEKLAAEDILRLLERLPDHLRIVFSLVVFDGYTHAEVAAELEIAETASRWRLMKSRELLQGYYRAVHPGKENEL